MNRAQQIRQEAIRNEEHWHRRRMGATRIALQEASDMGMSIAEAASYVGVTYNYVSKTGRDYGITFADKRTTVIEARRVDHVDVRATVKETAIANRGNASANQIAAAVGCSKNTIIGHWFRARQEGLIQ